MNKPLITALGALLLGASPVLLAASPGVAAPAKASQSTDAVAADLATRALASDLPMQIVTDLTTEIGPRLAGTEAEKRAANWAEATLKKLGFENVRQESFSITGWLRGEEKAEITGPSPQPLVVTSLGTSVATPPEGIEAEVVIFKRYADLLAAAEGSLKGKIALVTEKTVRMQDGSGYGAAGAVRRYGASEAAKRGAVAYMLRSLGTHDHRFPHTGSQVYAEGAPKIPAAAISPPDVEQIERLAARGHTVKVKLKLTPSHPGIVTSQNVIAEVKGREKPEEIILIGAHLDSWDQGTGAIDDGAGVAIVTTAAKLIRDLPLRPKRTIRVVLFGAEEYGLLGAKAYAEKHKADANKHILATEADFGQGPVYAFHTRVADPNHPSIVRIQNALTPLGIYRGNNTAHGGPDIGALMQLGVPVVNLALEGSDYFDTHHTPDDTLDRIERKRINQATAAYAAFTYLAAELDGDYRQKTIASTVGAAPASN